MKIALIAHDQMKPAMVDFAREHIDFLRSKVIIATSTTGQMLKRELGLEVVTVLSGPLGGDAQVSAMVATGEIQAVIFLRDPLTAQPHEPDISALLRICDVHNIPLATNRGTATHLLQSLCLKRL